MAIRLLLLLALLLTFGCGGVECEPFEYDRSASTHCTVVCDAAGVSQETCTRKMP